MIVQAQRIREIAQAIIADARQLPDHREVMARVGSAEFHRLLALEIQDQTQRTGWHMTWRQVAPELVEDGVEAWALIMVAKVRLIIDEATLVIGGVWVLDTERSARVELVATAAAANIAAMREQTDGEVDMLLARAREYLRTILPEHPNPVARAAASRLLASNPTTFHDIVMAGRLLGAPVNIRFR